MVILVWSYTVFFLSAFNTYHKLHIHLLQQKKTQIATFCKLIDTKHVITNNKHLIAADLSHNFVITWSVLWLILRG